MHHLPREAERRMGRAERAGVIGWTVKEGVVYDAPEVLEGGAEMLRQQKKERGMDPKAPLPRP